MLGWAQNIHPWVCLLGNMRETGKVGTRLWVQGGWLSWEAPGHSCYFCFDCTDTHEPNCFAVLGGMEKVGPSSKALLYFMSSFSLAGL